VSLSAGSLAGRVRRLTRWLGRRRAGRVACVPSHRALAVLSPAVPPAGSLVDLPVALLVGSL